MNRGQTAVVGAILVTAAMFRVGATSPSNPSAGSKPPPANETTLKPTASEGPWLASCKYWTAARWKAPLSKAVAPQVIESEDDPTTDCEDSGDRWGIPKISSDGVNATNSISADDVHQLEIRAIIAAVPDPVHSHLALEFDRTIDSLMQAAADNRYLGSNYWLPWKAPHTSSALAESSTTGQTEDEPQPRAATRPHHPEVHSLAGR